MSPMLKAMTPSGDALLAPAAQAEQAPANAATPSSDVGGDRVEVATLVGPNGDVHVYSPTPADTKSLSTAKAVFVNGLGLEGWVTN